MNKQNEFLIFSTVTNSPFVHDFTSFFGDVVAFQTNTVYKDLPYRDV